MTAPGTFTDRLGRTHVLRLTVADIRPLAWGGFDLAKLAGGEAAEVLYDDPVALVAACHRLTRSPGSVAGFAAAFDAGTLDAARSAVIEAVSDFFPALPDQPRPARDEPPATAEGLWRSCVELGGVCGVDPDGRTMRELWYLACGRWDMDVMGRAFWLSQFGVKVTAEQLADMHPLRKIERPPPPPKTPEERAVESRAGWNLIRQFFKQKKRR